jgi:hypothetical protein
VSRQSLTAAHTKPSANCWRAAVALQSHPNDIGVVLQMKCAASMRQVAIPVGLKRSLHARRLIVTAHKVPQLLALANWSTIDGVNDACTYAPSLI